MNIWDSVHRSLDKASKEAGRIARMQRLRSQLDKVARQINTQEGALLHQVMDLFASGRLTQAELLPICHELMSLQQQLSQAQSELQTLQSQVQQTPQAGQDINAPATMAGEIAPTTYAPPPSAPIYQPFDATMPAILPPPPPPESQTLHSQETVMNTIPVGSAGDAFTISAQETVRARDEAYDAGRDEMPASEGQREGSENRRRCPQCNTEALPGYYFCQNCGSALLPQDSNYQPTVRASGAFYQPGQETILPSSRSEHDESYQAGSSLSSNKGDATVYDAYNEHSEPNAYSAPPPPPSNSGPAVKDSELKDGGQ